MGSPMNVALCSGGRTARNIVVAQIIHTPQVATLGTHGGLKHDQQNTLSLKFIRCGVCPSQLFGSTSVQRITPRCCYSDAFLLSSTYQHQHEPQPACQRPLSTPCWPALPPCGGEGGAYPPPKQLPLTRSLQYVGRIKKTGGPYSHPSGDTLNVMWHSKIQARLSIDPCTQPQMHTLRPLLL